MPNPGKRGRPRSSGQGSLDRQRERLPLPGTLLCFGTEVRSWQDAAFPVNSFVGIWPANQIAPDESLPGTFLSFSMIGRCKYSNEPHEAGRVVCKKRTFETDHVKRCRTCFQGSRNYVETTPKRKDHQRTALTSHKAKSSIQRQLATDPHLSDLSRNRP